MQFTIQITARNLGVDYGIIKQIVFNSPDAVGAYDKHSDVLAKYLSGEKSKNGFTGCFIGHCLKLYDEGEISFNLNSSQFEITNDVFKPELIGWTDASGKTIKGNPRIKKSN